MAMHNRDINDNENHNDVNIDGIDAGLPLLDSCELLCEKRKVDPSWGLFQAADPGVTEVLHCI